MWTFGSKNVQIYRRTLHTDSNLSIVVYNNVKLDKSLILKNNKNKTGIYRWTNIINSKTYVGSANDLTIRLRVYFSVSRLNKSHSAIYKAILKYGHANFKLEILEYCNSDVLLAREQYYLDLLKPAYNILSIAGSSLGYKHTVQTLDKFKVRTFSSKTLDNLSKSALGRVLSDETKAKISVAHKGKTLSEATRSKLSVITTERIGIRVEVINTVTGQIYLYDSLTSAALTLGVSRTAIKKAMDLGRLIGKTFSIKFIAKN